MGVLPFLSRRWTLARVLLAAALLSSAFEVGQCLLHQGRSSDIFDVIPNVGAGLGWLAWWLCRGSSGPPPIRAPDRGGAAQRGFGWDTGTGARVAQEPEPGRVVGHGYRADVGQRCRTYTLIRAHRSAAWLRPEPPRPSAVRGHIWPLTCGFLGGPCRDRTCDTRVKSLNRCAGRRLEMCPDVRIPYSGVPVVSHPCSTSCGLAAAWDSRPARSGTNQNLNRATTTSGRRAARSRRARSDAPHPWRSSVERHHPRMTQSELATTKG